MTLPPEEQVSASATCDPKRATARFIERIPRDFARRHLVLSQGDDADGELLACAHVTRTSVVFNVGTRLGRSVRSILTDAESLAAAIDDAYADASNMSSTASGIGEHLGTTDAADGRFDLDRLIARADRDLLSTDGKAPVVKLLDALLFEALRLGASDVHLQPIDGGALVRYRLDGVLRTAHNLPGAVVPALTSRIKVMGRMDIAERRIAQDGRATVTITDRSIDLRISTVPTSWGERAVLRLLDQGRQLCDFDSLGMPPGVARPFLRAAQRANGIILVTGPTGSGKSTTLYSTLRRIGVPELNILTIEDPIEFEFGSVGLPISQIQVNARKGMNFATGLRNILRQDPDVVMVGEIRDVETARIAFNASNTGHLVLSTLHTNDACGAVTRLIDLGVDPYLVSGSLLAVLAQRLVRLTHSSCGGDGCDECAGSGYRGRTGIFELLLITEAIRELVARAAPLAQLRDGARARGMRTLFEEGERLIQESRTSRLEVARVAQGVDEVDS